MSETPAAGRDLRDRNHEAPVVSDDAVSAWFIREILPLEAILMSYLRQNWRNASDVPDLRQEAYARVLQAARETLPENPKRFLLTTARNLLIDLIRREQVVPMDTFADFDALEVAADTPQPDRLIIQQEELRRIEAALEQLPARTREAIRLAYAENLSCTEIAKRMGVSQPTASEFLAKGSLLLADILYGPAAGRSAQ